MIKDIKLSPSMMCVNWLDAKQDLDFINSSRVFDSLHIDITDGKFVPDFTMGTSIIDIFRANTKLPFDFHFMVEEPRNLFETFDPKPGDTVIVHQECVRNLHRDLVYLKSFGCKVGVALCPATSISTLDYILDDLQEVLLLSVDPGFKGGDLVPNVLRKVSDLKKLIIECELDIEIVIDGNVSFMNIPNMVSAGANRLVLGSSGLFTADLDLNKSLQKIKNILSNGSQ